MLRAERDLARARLASAKLNELEAAVTGLRELSTPYHLAHGLLDYAAELARRGQAEAVAAAADEATAIAVQLRCQPLLDRAADLTSGEAEAVLPRGDDPPGPPATAATGARPRTRATGTRP